MTDETILDIREISEKEPGDYDCMEGFEVRTDKQRITLTIRGGQSCCERSGYFMSEDNVQAFVGAKLLGIKLTDTALNSEAMKANSLTGEDYETPDLMFVDLETDRGPLQFVAYNVHNGYYGHEARVRSAQLTHEVSL